MYHFLSNSSQNFQNMIYFIINFLFFAGNFTTYGSNKIRVHLA